MVRRSSTERFDRIEHLRDRLTLHQGDLLDQRSLVDALRASQPDEIYNLAAMSFVAVSWVQPTLTAEFSGVGVTRILEAIREVCPRGALLPGLLERDVRQGPRGAADRADAVLPALARTASRRPTGTSSPSTTARATTCTRPAGSSSTTSRRGAASSSSTRKITWHAAAIKLGLADELRLGNLDAERDWGYAKDYVEAMWLMLQRDEPDDYVIATGIAHSVRDVRRDRLRPGRARGRRPRRDRPGAGAPGRGRPPDRRPRKADRAARLEADDRLRDDDPDDGRRRPRAAARAESGDDRSLAPRGATRRYARAMTITDSFTSRPHRRAAR